MGVKLPRRANIMGFEVKKTEHGGPKHGHGFWGRKADAKRQSSRTRRRLQAQEIRRAVAEPSVPNSERWETHENAKAV